MAIFNPQNPTEPENRMNYSQGYKPDLSTATLIEDSGKLMSLGVAVTDEAIKKGIKEEARAAVEPVRDSATSYLETKQYEIPSEVTQGISKLGAMTEAKASGRLNESHYWNLLDAKARELRARHPGYKDYVDERIASLAGANPANRLVQELFQEAKAGQGSAQKEYDWMFKQAVELGVVPDYAEQASKGTPYTYAELTSKVTKRRADIAYIQLTRDQLQLKHAKKADTEDDNIQAASKEIQTYMTDFVYNATGPESKLQEMLKTANATAGANGGNYSPEELTRISAAVNQAKMAYTSHVNKVMTAPFKDGSSYYTRIPKAADRENLLNQGLDYFKAWEVALHSKDGGMMGALANANELQMQGDIRAITSDAKDGPFFRRAQVLQKLMGPYAVQMNVFQRPEGISKIGNFLYNNAQIDSWSGKSGDTNATDTFKSLKAQKAESSVYRANLDKNLTELGKANIPANVFEEAAHFYFGPKNMGFLTAVDEKTGQPILNFDDKFGLYQKMVDPRVVANFIKYAAEKPELYNNFKQWTQYNFAALMKEAASNAQKLAVNSPNYTLRYDLETSNFVADPIKNPQIDSSSASPINIYEKFAIDRPGQKAINDINKVLNGYKALLIAEKKDPRTELPALINSLMINPNAAKEPSGPRSLRDNLVGALKKTEAEAAKTEGGTSTRAKSPEPSKVPETPRESTPSRVPETPREYKDGQVLQAPDDRGWNIKKINGKWMQQFPDGTIGLEVDSKGNVIQPNNTPAVRKIQ